MCCSPLGLMVPQNRWKDFRTLREAVALLAEHPGLQNLLLIVLGMDAPPEQAGQARIRFIPFQDEAKMVARYYQAADLYVHAALVDTFPLGVLEAMACGTPVVATSVGGIPEQVEEGRTGILVRAGDPDGMAAGIAQLLLDSGVREGMGKMAAESARRRFDLGRHVDAYLDWYYEQSEDFLPKI
jgi:glycosyltransferase involved in cell wall biosynthesis